MNVRYKEHPAAWRKTTLLTLLGLGLISTLARGRHVLNSPQWFGVLAGLGCAALSACLRPTWFRGFYRFSTWAGFWSSQAVVRFFLAMVFVLLITPAGLILRLLGKDSLHLKRSPRAASYWRQAKPGGSLDRSF